MPLLKQKISIASCGVCNCSSLDLIWDLPKFPLTEKYGSYSPGNLLHADQELLICNECGHVQLATQIPPEILYTPSAYSFRTSQSKTAQAGAKVFFDFYHKIRKERKFHSLLDIGGNDLFLAKMTKLESRCVIDPICSTQNGQMVDGIKILGKFIEEVDFQKEGLNPDLIFCRHVLEHVANPKELLYNLFQQCPPEALYIFEIPCFENLVEANRFDAIFHQHYHYFDLSTFRRLIFEAGGIYIDHLYNRQGSCGGSLMIAFSKARSLKESMPLQDTSQRKIRLLQAIEEYQHLMNLLSSQLQKFHQNVYGYGASLMLATLAYHLRTDFSNLVCILDDDKQKDNIGYQNLPVKVRYSGNFAISPDSNFLITSLENTRAIFNRLMEFSPRRVLVPVIC